jgi:site-specific recombinase XerD
LTAPRLGLLTGKLGIIALRHRQQAGKEKSVIETFFVQPKVLARMRSGPAGRYLPTIGVQLQQQGYSRDSIRRHLRAADAFGRWLSDHGLSLCDTNPSIVGRYVETLGRLVAPSTPNGRRPHKAIGLHHLLEVLQAQGVTSAADIGQSSGIERCLSEFDHYLDQVAGNASRTRTNYMRYARRLLDRRFGSAEPDWSRLQADYIADFVRQEAARMQPSSCRQPVTAIRSLLRFLVANGVVAVGLEEAVPPILTWRHAALPKHISAAEVERVIAACDVKTGTGLRARAVIMLLAHLGLRAHEIIRLRLDDIDWIRGQVLVRAGKCHRERCLPLSHEVGDALVAYLRKARPATSHQELFLRWRPPFRPLKSSVSITALVKGLMKRAKVEVHRSGAHVFRHSLATRMVCCGATFKEVADILGHQSVGTTAIYAKLDLPSLSQVALPWPGGVR